MGAQDAAAANTTADNATVVSVGDNATAPATGDEANSKADCTCPTKEPSSEIPKSDAVQASPQSADNSIAVNGQPFQAVSPAVRRKRQAPEAPAASVAVVPPVPAIPVMTSLNIAPVSVSEGDLQAAAVAAYPEPASAPEPASTALYPPLPAAAVAI